ncbi:MAG: WD40/YVTN/BNR-like repeat-containing protein [Ktedonobacteraceae bacterium]
MRYVRYIPLLFLLLAISACAPSSGIFAGSGGGWQSTGLARQHIHALTVNPNNALMLFAGDVRGSVYMSTDGSQHWTQRSAVPSQAKTILALSFDTTGKKLYATTDAGIFVTTNNAGSWSVVSTAHSGLPLDSYPTIAFDYHNSMIIYAGSAHHGVFISNDGGTSWSAMNTGLPTNVAINGLTLDSDEHQLWAATSAGVYRTATGTIAWQAFNSGLPANVAAYAVQPAFISGGAQGLVFVGTNHGFYRSAVYGNQWTASQESLARLTIYTILIDVSQPTTIYVGTNIGAFRSNDNGQNWSGLTEGIPTGQAVYGLLFGNSGGSQMYAAANNVYMYPGSSSGFSFSQLLPILIIVLFFYLLYRLTKGSRNRRREILKPERIIEASPAPEEKDDHPVSQ